MVFDEPEIVPCGPNKESARWVWNLLFSSQALLLPPVFHIKNSLHSAQTRSLTTISIMDDILEGYHMELADLCTELATGIARLGKMREGDVARNQVPYTLAPCTFNMFVMLHICYYFFAENCLPFWEAPASEGGVQTVQEGFA